MNPDNFTPIEDSIYASTDFDYDAVDGVPCLAESEPTTVEFQMAGVALRDVLEWALRGAVDGVPVKIQAAVWVMCPSIYGNCSQSELAAQLGRSPHSLAYHVRSFRDTFRFRNHLMRDDDTRQRNAEVQRRRHGKGGTAQQEKV